MMARMRVCAEPGCGALVERGCCPAHAPRRRTSTRRWRRLRTRVLRRAGGCCERCGRRVALAVHHVEPVGKGGVELADLDKLRALCAACHLEAHRGPGPAGGRRPLADSASTSLRMTAGRAVSPRERS